MMSIRFLSQNKSRTVEADAETPLSTLASEAGLSLNMQCGGQGACRGCMVELRKGTYRIGENETVVAEGETEEARGCKTVVLSEIAEVEIPDRSRLKIGECVTADFYATRKNIFVPCENVEGQLGVAVDIGTTTVAALLVELSTGEILAHESVYNRQIELADNIASRIALCREDANVKELQRLIIQETLLPILLSMCKSAGRPSEDLFEIVFSGNTVMSHLALGLSPLCIGTIPFEPITKVYSDHAASELGLNGSKVRVRTVPSIAGYVGGDVVCDLYVSEPDGADIELLVDIGTNGEIVLNDRGSLMATATAAGPAFEGAGLLHGCRAAEGVIETIICNPDDSFSVEIIGEKPATGLCGSAVVDFIATALKTGVLNRTGRFDIDRLKAAGRWVDYAGIHSCIIVPQEQAGIAGPVLVTEYDISQILKAKAAVYAGICTLLERGGYALSDVKRLVLAGGFAAHLKLENAIMIGLLPELPQSVFDVVGNGSLAGAYAALGEPTVFEELHRIAEKPDSCHLAETHEFESRFVDALALPNLDPDEFPLTVEQLEKGFDRITG